LLSDLSGKLDQVEGLVEVTLGGSDGDFSANLDVDGEVDFSGQSGAFDVDDTDCLDVLLALAAFDDIDEILGLSRLRDHSDSFSGDDVILRKLDGVDDVDFLEGFEELEEVMAGAGSIVAGTAA
jgi:hypothetical protein